MREFPRLMRGGVRLVEELHYGSADPEAFAPRCLAFRLGKEQEKNR